MSGLAIEGLRRQARKEFLGRGSVLGVGISEEAGEQLVFLLEKDAPETRREIQEWARQHGVTVMFIVTGRIRAPGHT